MTVRNDPAHRRDRAQERHEEWSEEYDYGDHGVESDLEAEEVGYKDKLYGPSTYPASGGSAYGANSKNMGTGVANGGALPEPPSQEAFAHLQQLMKQGLSKEQVMTQMQQLYGWTPNEGDFSYAQQGLGAFHGPPSGYTAKYLHGSQGKTVSKAYGTPEFQQWMDQQHQAQESKSMARDAKKKEQEAKVKIHMILLQIMMGDIAGALRSYAVLMDRDLRQFTRLIVKKLDGVRKARSTVIRNFARTKPPRAYAGQNPQTAARAQDKSAKYTQFVQMNTQLMNELQNTERELVDALQTQFRNAETFWQTVATFRDETFRTNDRVMTMR